MFCDESLVSVCGESARDLKIGVSISSVSQPTELFSVCFSIFSISVICIARVCTNVWKGVGTRTIAIICCFSIVFVI